jgi:membrane-associated phospholipid phosphatase
MPGFTYLTSTFRRWRQFIRSRLPADSHPMFEEAGMTALDATGPAWPVLVEVGRRLLRAVVLPAMALYVLLIAVGLLLAHPLARAVAGEDAVDRGLVAQRTPRWTSITGVVQTLGGTGMVIGTMLVAALVLRLVFARWREAVTLVVAVSLEAVLFVLTTLVIDRDRPLVARLDLAPPTSSFPSGHTGAATALYLGLGFILAWHTRRVLFRVLLVIALLSIPVAVGLSRMYRGMHHPTDVAFGMLNGLACIAIAAYAYLLSDRGDAPSSGVVAGR